jgi:hypothetical protein
VVHAEIWPGVVGPETERLLLADPTLIRDQAQVRAMVEWAASHDAGGSLARQFDVPANLGYTERLRCEREEGWILGA